MLTRILLSFGNSNTEQEGEEEFVFFKQRAADVLVYAVGEVSIQVHNPLNNILWLLTIYYWL